MKSKIWLLALVGAVLLGPGTAWAQADFYVIAAGPTAVGTKIASVPYTINSSGFYYLTGDLTYSGSDAAITVNVNGVTLDLMGFKLSGPGAGTIALGISIFDRVNVEVRNGTVADFGTGVSEGSGNKHRIINIRATNNSTGINLLGKNHLIKNCSASNNTHGGLVIESGLIVDNVANDNGFTGITLLGPGSILGNTACNNGSNNFSIGNGVPTSILVDRNSAFGSSPNYAIVSGTSGVVITANNSGTP